MAVIHRLNKKRSSGLVLLIILIMLAGCKREAANPVEASGTNPEASTGPETGTDTTGENDQVIYIDYTGQDPVQPKDGDITSGNEEGGDETYDLFSEPGSGQNSEPPYKNREEISLDPSWTYADFSKINSGAAVFYTTQASRKGITVGVNAGHGTKGGSSVKTYCHPDKSPKVTGGTTPTGSIESYAVSEGMTFKDGTSEASVNLRMAQYFRDELLARGYDVLMVRDSDDVQLDNVARTVICNNAADCHIAIHWDGDALDYDKGCFYMSVPDKLKSMEPVSVHWEEHEKLGEALIKGLKSGDFKIYNGGSMDMDLTQTSFSTVPSTDIELGNKASDHSDKNLKAIAVSMADGIDIFFSGEKTVDGVPE